MLGTAQSDGITGAFASRDLGAISAAVQKTIHSVDRCLPINHVPTLVDGKAESVNLHDKGEDHPESRTPI
jgi:hypothetical protein